MTTKAEVLELDGQVAQLLLGNQLTAAEIADRLDIGERQVRRVLERLTSRGLPVIGVDAVKERREVGRPVTRYRIAMPAGRVCSSPGCGTRLRSTNPSDRCELHGGGYLDLEEVRPMHVASAAR